MSTMITQSTNIHLVTIVVKAVYRRIRNGARSTVADKIRNERNVLLSALRVVV